MAAGTSRILRYVLFAFFVGIALSIFLALANSAIGCYDSLFHIPFIDTQTGNTWGLKLREVEGEEK